MSGDYFLLPFETNSFDKTSYFRLGCSLFASAIVYYLIKLGKSIYSIIIRKRSPPFEGLPSCSDQVPPHWLFGHFKYLLGKGLTGNKQIMVDSAGADNGICSFWLLHIPVVSFLHGVDAQQVLKSSVTRKASLARKHVERFIGMDSIIMIEGGVKWKVSRDVVHKAFTIKAMEELQPCLAHLASVFTSSIGRTIDQETTDTRHPREVDKVNGYLGLSPDGKGIILDYLCVFKMFTIDTFGLCALGQDLKCSKTLTKSKYATAFETLQDDFQMRLLQGFFNPLLNYYWLPTAQNRKQKEASQLLRGFLLETIQKRRAPENNGNTGGMDVPAKILLDHLAEALDSDKLTDKNLLDSLVTLLLAGYETTSITLPYACYLLAKNPKVEELCVQEVRAVLGPSGSPIPKGINPLNDLPYCRAVVYETLRLYPSAVTIFRNLEKPMELKQEAVTLPAGTRVQLPIWFIQRDPRNFPYPEEFAPERWVTRNDEGEWVERFESKNKVVKESEMEGEEKRIPPANRNAFIAFSAGARSCVGRRFAMQEAIIGFAACVRDLQFELVDGYEPEPVRKGALQVPKNGMPLITKRRKN